MKRCVFAVTLGTMTVDTILELANAPKIIDYMSLDVEGHGVSLLVLFIRFVKRALQ